MSEVDQLSARIAVLMRERLFLDPPSVDTDLVDVGALDSAGFMELGRTLSRADGMFDLAVNGGGLLTVPYAKAGFPPALALPEVRALPSGWGASAVSHRRASLVALALAFLDDLGFFPPHALPRTPAALPESPSALPARQAA